jgi:uncharacterized protein (TIGR02246 family)
MEETALRIQRLEDERELRELAARYGRAIDDRDIAGVKELFCPDGEFRDGTGNALATGREAIGDYYRGFVDSYTFSIHVPLTQLVESIEGDEARGWVLGRAELGEADRTGVATMRYEDEYRRIGGRWRFASRTTRIYYFCAWAEIGALGATADRVRFRGVPRLPDLPPHSAQGMAPR